jgi:Arc/MetJ-type ribon-helix-helix transcriptional regulator
MISFRVSEEEFQTLREVCSGERFNSVSELVRAAVQELVANRAQQGPKAVAGAVQTLITRVDALDQNLKELMNHRTSMAG